MNNPASDWLVLIRSLVAGFDSTPDSQNTPNTARLEHDNALDRAMLSLLKDDNEVYKQFVQNDSFRRFVTDMVFGLTNQIKPTETTLQ